MATVRQVTFAVKGSGSGGAGWIGKVDGQGSNACQGVYFGHPQEYTTTDPHMIEALEKSGVTVILNDEEVEKEVAMGKPDALVKVDDDGNPGDLRAMSLMDLALKCKQLGIPVTAKLNTKAKRIEAIENFKPPEE